MIGDKTRPACLFGAQMGRELVRRGIDGFHAERE
jgi:hypothetical protein